ncbi:DNA polymerase thumb domain-containing protein [Kitasatospora sp. NPDC050543]|uniref:DNA polymerase Y family protein n=1 Tax=Kitasatospora sp. NPDC050543 TaxID=3364054 RepID=UPI00379E943B
MNSSCLHAALACDTCHVGQTRILTAGSPDTERFLRSRPVEALPGIGPKLGRTLTRYVVTTIGDLADLPLPTIQRITGAAAGRLLHDRAHGIDPRTVAPNGPPASLTVSRRFDADVLDPGVQRQALLDLGTDLGARLRTSRQTTRALELTVTYADRSTTTRSRTLREPTAHTPALRDALYAGGGRTGSRHGARRREAAFQLVGRV